MTMPISRLSPALVGALFAGITFFSADIAFAEETVTPRFVVEVEGDGTPVIFIPGLTSSPEAFQAGITQPLNAQAHWITVSGFAGAPAAAASEDMIGDTAEAIAAYIASEELTDVRLVGHSMGGVLSILVAGQVPERVNGVLIVDSVPFLPALFQPGATEEAAKPQARAMQAQFDAMDETAFLAMMRSGLPVQATSAASQDFVFKDIEASDKDTVAAATVQLMSTDYGPALASVKAPTTVLIPHNAYLGVTPDAIKARYAGLYEGLANANFEVIPESRHFIMLDQPEAFEAALTNFLEAN